MSIEMYDSGDVDEAYSKGYQQGREDAIKDTELFREIFLEYLIKQSVDREEAIMYRNICGNVFEQLKDHNAKNEEAN